MRIARYILMGLLSGALTAAAQVRETWTVQSRTGQFAVQSVHTYGSTQRATPAPLRAPAGDGWFFLLRPGQIKPHRDITKDIPVTLTPAVAAVACEQIKEALLRELGMTDGWRQKIHIQLDPDLGEEDITITATPHPRGWMYVVHLPETLDESALVRTAVIALLYEIAHREFEEASVELPLWLVEGLVAHLRATSLATVVPQANLSINRVQVKGSPMARANELLKTREALTFEELSWPNQLPVEQAALFRECAHLFVHELLKLRGGQERLSHFVQELANYQNWQFAFLRAFSGQFNHLRDVEKWWGLTVVNFTARGPAQFWTYEDALQALEQALVFPMQQRDAPNERRVLTLQQALQEWDYSQHRAVVQRSVVQLRFLQQRAPAELFPLVDEYRVVLERYLQPGLHSQTGTPRGTQPAININAVRQTTVRQLNDLDQRRLSLREDAAGG